MMTGRDLILYIMNNHLENYPVFQHGRFLDFLTIKEAAVKFGVGESTVRVWAKMNTLPHVVVGDQIFIPKDATTSHCIDENILKGLASFTSSGKEG